MKSESESNPAPRPRRFLKNAAAVALLLAILAMLGLRLSQIAHTPGQPHQSNAAGRNGLTDYRDVVYYPLRAVLDGVNPYDCDTTTALPNGEPRYRQRYPVFNIFPLYSPLVLILYSPLGWFDFPTSVAIFIVSNVLQVLLLAYSAWRMIGKRPSIAAVATLASIILATNAGRSNFLGGETALPLALATNAAAYYSGRRSGLAGLALGIASFKPTIGLPLGISLLFRRDWRSVALGWGLGFAIGAAGLVAIFYRSGDLDRMPQILIDNQQVVESDPHVDPRLSAARVDAASAMERLIPLGRGMQLAATLGVLGLAGAGLRLLARQDSLEAAEASRTIVCLATLGSMYHATYDAVVLWPAIVSLACAAPAYWWSGPRWLRPALLACLLIPMLNVLPTPIFAGALDRLTPHFATLSPVWRQVGWTFACTLNGFALLTAIVLLTWHSWRLGADRRTVPL